MKSADGADKFLKDAASGKLDQWLLRTLLFTCLEYQNHMRSFTGGDGRTYRNELCLDTSNGNTVGFRDARRSSIAAFAKASFWPHGLGSLRRQRKRLYTTARLRMVSIR